MIQPLLSLYSIVIMQLYWQLVETFKLRDKSPNTQYCCGNACVWLDIFIVWVSDVKKSRRCMCRYYYNLVSCYEHAGFTNRGKFSVVMSVVVAILIAPVCVAWFRTKYLLMIIRDNWLDYLNIYPPCYVTEIIVCMQSNFFFTNYCAWITTLYSSVWYGQWPIWYTCVLHIIRQWSVIHGMEYIDALSH